MLVVVAFMAIDVQPASAATATGVATGGLHTCALTTAGGLKCWGKNDFGQLGDGTTTNLNTPVDVSGLTSGVAAVSVGGSDFHGHTCAVTTGGGLKCWGRNFDGELGDGTTTGRTTPVDVVGLSSGVAAVSASLVHTCALTTAGGVKCWGRNNFGQLGDGTTTNRTTPVDVVGLSSGVAAVSASPVHTCALTTAGGVKCWGGNAGQLGDGTTTNRTAPVNVVGLTSGVAAVSAGGSYTCAVTTGVGLKCWGDNFSGQLGDGTTTRRTTPVDVVGLTSGVAAVTTGFIHTCALTTAGGVRCWGRNLFGELGNGTGFTQTTPVDVVGLTVGAGAVSAGQDHTCAMTQGAA